MKKKYFLFIEKPPTGKLNIVNISNIKFEQEDVYDLLESLKIEPSDDSLKSIFNAVKDI